MADLFALYIKTKNFHWHVSARIFATITCCWTSKSEQILTTTDILRNGVRKIGGVTLHSIGKIARSASVCRQRGGVVPAAGTCWPACQDNGQLAVRLKERHRICDEHEDVASQA